MARLKKTREDRQGTRQDRQGYHRRRRIAKSDAGQQDPRKETRRRPNPKTPQPLRRQAADRLPCRRPQGLAQGHQSQGSHERRYEGRLRVPQQGLKLNRLHVHSKGSSVHEYLPRPLRSRVARTHRPTGSGLSGRVFFHLVQRTLFVWAIYGLTWREVSAKLRGPLFAAKQYD